MGNHFYFCAHLLAKFARKRLFGPFARLDLAADELLFVRDVRVFALAAHGSEHFPFSDKDPADDLYMLFHDFFPPLQNFSR